MKYVNDLERRYLNYHRDYTAKNVRRVTIYDDGKCIVVEKIVEERKKKWNSTSLEQSCSA